MDPTLVIKHEARGKEFQNTQEWNLWNEIVNHKPYQKYRKWFAPCVACSPNGVWLVMAKVTYPEKNKYPKKLPAYFSDTKYNNFGLFNDKFVCSDYGFMTIVKPGNIDKLKKVEWWSQ